MPITTYILTVTVNKSNGDAIAGAIVSCKLNDTDFDSAQGTITPERMTATTDVNGQCTFNLWPNTAGSNNTHYVVTAQSSDQRHTYFKVKAAMPAANSNLNAIASLPV